jgi:hypothetical protein
VLNPPQSAQRAQRVKRIAKGSIVVQQQGLAGVDLDTPTRAPLDPGVLQGLAQHPKIGTEMAGTMLRWRCEQGDRVADPG